MSLKKLVRTIQSHFWFLKEAKDEFYIHYRRLLRMPAEPFFRALPLIRRHFTGCYIDVGGNIGQSIEAMKLFVPDAKIFSFEPNPNLAAKLARRYRGDPNVEIRSLGLSDKQCRLKLFVPVYRGFVYDGLGSLDFKSAQSWICNETIYGFQSNRLSVNEYECDVETLDTQNLTDPIFIKIDVQGTEYEVVNGAIEILRKHEPVLLIEDFHIKQELQKLTESLGYKPYKFDGRTFVLGPSNTSTFLLTDARLEVIQSTIDP